MASSPVMRPGLLATNGKRPLLPRGPPLPRADLTAACHDDNVQFIHRTWVQVETGMSREGGAQRYLDKDTGHNPYIASFTPVDLEALAQKRKLLTTEKHSA